MAGNTVDIRITTSGAEQAARVLQGIGKEGGAIGSVVGSGVAKAEQALGAFGRSAQNVSGLMSQAGINTGIFGQAVGALGGPFGAAAAGAVALGVAIKTTTDYMVKNYEQMRQLMAVSGLEAEAADQLADTFDLLGFNVDALRAAMFKMSAEIDSGGKGFRALGLSIRDSAGNLKTEGALFLEIRDRISAMGSASQRNAALIDIFGRSGRELAAVFALNSTEFNKWLEAAGKIGPSAAESMRVTEEYTRASNALKKEWEGMVETLGQSLLPRLTELLKVMRDLASVKPGETGDSWVSWLNELGSAIPAPLAALALLTEGARKAKKELAGIASGDEDFGLGRPSTAVGPIIQKQAQEELDKFRQSLEVLRGSQLDQPIIKINQAFKEFAEKWGPAAAAQMRPLVNELIGLTRAAQAVPDQLAAMKARAAEVSDVLREAQLILDIKVLDDELKALSITLGANADAVKKDADALREEAAAADLAAEALKNIAPLAEAVTATFSEGGERFTDNVIAANRELRALQATSDLDADSIRRFGLSFKNLDAATQASLLSLRGWNAEAASIKSADALAAIDRQAALLGPSFDAASAKAGEFQRRILELQAIRNPTGDILAEIDELKAKFADTRDFIEWRGMFQDIFSSVGGAINTLVQGVILGTQTMGDAFKKLGQSIVIEFVNRVIQQALNPLMKAAANVVASLFTGTPGTGASSPGAVAAIGEAGEPSALGTIGFQNTANSLGNFTSALGLATGGTGAFSQVLTGITSGWDAGFGGATAALSGGFEALQAVSAAASGLTVGLAGVGAALAVFSTTMDFVNGKTEEAIGGLVGGIAGGVAGGIWFGPLGALVGGALGDLLGSWLGGLFGGGPGNYELKRAMAEADANAQVGGITTGFAAAAHAGTSAATLAGLQSGQVPWGSTPNPLRTDLSLPPALAEQLGLAAKAELENGRAIVHWADVTQAQFDELITLFKSDPSMIAGSVRGKGDVSYLGQDKTHALGDQLEQGAVALLTAFTAFDSVRDKINGLAADIVAAAGEVMPPNMAQELAAHIVNPIRDGMLAVLQDPDLSVEDMQAELDKMGATLEAKVASWEQFAQAMQAAQIIAPSMPDDLPERMTAALAPAYDAVVTTMRNGTARQAQAAADGYAKQVALWAAFGEAVTHAIDLEAVLPEDLGSRFEAKMQPQYDKILATLEAGNVSLATAQVAAYTKQMAAWASIGQTVSKITSELAANSGDTSSAVETWQAVQGEMDRTVARAKVAFDAAVNSGDIERVAKTAATYHDATMARLQAERAAVQQIESALAELFKAAAAVQDTLAGLAAADVGRGDASAFTEILHALADIAMVAPTVNQRLSAIGSGFSAIVAALANTDVDALLDPLTLIAQTSSAAAPFFGALGDLIETATKAGDLKGALGLLQQQAEAIKQLGAAAVQAVHEWATAAIDAVEKEAAAKHKAIDEQADAEIKLRDAAIKNWQAQLAIAQTIEALYTGPNSPLSLTQQVAAAAGAGQAALSRFQAAPSAAGLATVQSAANRYLTIFTALINDQIALLQKWQAAVDSANGFIESLYTGPNSPLSLTEQRGLAAGAGQSALSAYNAGPTPEGLTALQAAASRYLTISLAQIREKADAEIAAVEASRDARVSALNAEIQAVQDAAAAEQQLIADRIDALQKQVSITREWEGVVKSVGDLIQSMVIGPMAAGNPADRLTAAKDAFAQSQAAFNANPTAANAADVQSAAQALLPLAEQLLSKPSPAYQALFASVIKVLEGVKGTAGAMAGPVSSADLEAQIKPLQEESKRIGDFAKQAVDGIQMQIEAVNRNAADTIKAINEAAAQEAKDITQGVIDALTAATALAPQDIPGQIAAKQKDLKDTVAAVIAILADAGQINGMSSDDLSTLIDGAQAQIDWWTHWRETEKQLVDDWKQAQIDAINETAKTTIANIEEGVAGALRQNAAAQKAITDKLIADTAGILTAVTRGAGSGLIDGVAFLAERSMEANGTLVEIRDAIRSVTGAATGIERVEPGLYELHKNEAVLTESQANKLRAMGGPRALDRIRSAAAGVGMNPLTDPDPANHLNDWNWIYNQPRDLSKEGFAWGGPKAAELNALELQMRQIMQQFEGTLAHNVQKKGGRRVQIYSDDEIALMRDAMTNQVKAIKDEQIAIIATVPKTPATPTTPPGTPPTVPPTVPPYTPPGPGWLTRTEGEQTDRSGGGVTLVIEKGAIVITGVSDPEKAANLAVEKVQTSVASGKIGLIIDQRVRSLPKK